MLGQGMIKKRIPELIQQLTPEACLASFLVFG